MFYYYQPSFISFSEEVDESTAIAAAFENQGKEEMNNNAMFQLGMHIFKQYIFKSIIISIDPTLTNMQVSLTEINFQASRVRN